MSGTPLDLRATRRANARTTLAQTGLTCLVFGAVLLLILPGLDEPARVERLTVDNPYAWAARVEVTASDDRGWLDLGTIDRESGRSFLAVNHQGEEWRFRFSYAGHTAELVVPSEQLERDEWRLTIPAQLARRLDDANVPESPP